MGIGIVLDPARAHFNGGTIGAGSTDGARMRAAGSPNSDLKIKHTVSTFIHTVCI
jgi:hypothetical protein